MMVSLRNELPVGLLPVRVCVGELGRHSCRRSNVVAAIAAAAAE